MPCPLVACGLPFEHTPLRGALRGNPPHHRAVGNSDRGRRKRVGARAAVGPPGHAHHRIRSSGRWRGHETRAVWGRQLEEFGGSFLVTADEIDAWEEGSVGWASVKETMDWEGKTIEGRATYVLHLEHGEWKIVRVHWSFPQPHTVVLGRSLTVTIEELEQAVQREKPDLSRTLDSDGTVTIVFTDIVDSTVLLFASVIMQARTRPPATALIEEATAKHGGTVVQTEGDGSMLAFRALDGRSHAHRRSNARSVVHSLTARLRSASESVSTRRRAERSRGLLRPDHSLRGARRQPGPRRRSPCFQCGPRPCRQPRHRLPGKS